MPAQIFSTDNEQEKDSKVTTSIVFQAQNSSGAEGSAKKKKSVLDMLGQILGDSVGSSLERIS